LLPLGVGGGEERRLGVFNNRVLRIFGPKRDEVTRKRRKLHNEERNDMHSPPNIVGVIKSRRMRLAWYVACKGKRRGAYRILVGKPKEKRPEPGVDGRKMLRWVFRKWNGARTGLIWLRIGTG